MITSIKFLIVIVFAINSAHLFADKLYPQCDHIRPLVDWFGNLDCKKVPDHENSLTFLPEENAVLFKVGKDIPKISTSWKNEFRDSIRPPLDSVYRYHLETKFYELGLPRRENSIVVAQWHDRKVDYDKYSVEVRERAQRARPPITIRVIKHQLYVILWNDKIFNEKNGDGTGIILYIQDIIFEKWYNFDFEIKWSAKGSGRFKFFINNKMVVNYNGPIGYILDTVGSYFKFGFYTVHPFNNFGYMQIAHRNYSRQRLK